MNKKIAEIPHENRGQESTGKPCRIPCREEDMLRMNQIDQIKELQRQGPDLWRSPAA